MIQNQESKIDFIIEIAKKLEFEGSRDFAIDLLSFVITTYDFKTTIDMTENEGINKIKHEIKRMAQVHNSSSYIDMFKIISTIILSCTLILVLILLFKSNIFDSKIETLSKRIEHLSENTTEQLIANAQRLIENRDYELAEKFLNQAFERVYSPEKIETIRKRLPFLKELNKLNIPPTIDSLAVVVQKQDKHIFNLLLNAGFEIDQQYGETTLLATAIAQDDLKSVEFLLENGANPFATIGSKQIRPLEFASSKQMKDLILKYLKQ